MKILKTLCFVSVVATGLTFFVINPVQADAPSFVAITEDYVPETTTADYAEEQAETIITVNTTIEETTILYEESEEETATTAEEIATEVIPETEPEIITTVEETEIETTTEYAPIWENIVFKDGASGNNYTYNSLVEAKQNISVNSLSDAEAKKLAKANKKKFKVEIDTLISLVNEYRAANGLNTLTADKTLTLAACHRAAESAYSNWNMTGYLDGSKRHLRPNYEVAKSICDVYGITGNFGENYARYFDTANDTLVGWQESEAHNSLLLSNSFTSIGIGVAIADNGDYYWIAIFN